MKQTLHKCRSSNLRFAYYYLPGGCDQPAAGCEPHHVTHRADGGRTSLANLKDYCCGIIMSCCPSWAGH
jgi:hypothetical protein